MNIKNEVSLTLQELIKSYECVMHVRYQSITQSIDDRHPDLDDATFKAVIEEAKKQLRDASQAWLYLNCG